MAIWSEWHKLSLRVCARPVRKRTSSAFPNWCPKTSKSGFKLDQAAPIATVPELAEYDGIIFGSGTRFGVATSQMRNFLDQTGPLWMTGALVGKVSPFLRARPPPACPGMGEARHREALDKGTIP
jgi:hypothetical protein